MLKFPIMAMREGDPVIVTDYLGKLHQGTVNWWNNDQGFRVSVKLDSGTVEVFEARGPRAAKFWH